MGLFYCSFYMFPASFMLSFSIVFLYFCRSNYWSLFLIYCLLLLLDLVSLSFLVFSPFSLLSLFCTCCHSSLSFFVLVVLYIFRRFQLVLVYFSCRFLFFFAVLSFPLVCRIIRPINNFCPPIRIFLIT